MGGCRVGGRGMGEGACLELREAQEELPAAVASLAGMRVRAHLYHSPMSRRIRETAHLQTSRLYITHVC